MAERGRPKKDYQILSLRLDRSVSEKLEDYCRETGQSKTMAVERMLANELEEYYSQAEGKRVPR